MNTGIYIRELVDGKWQSIDIGDTRLSNEQVLKWLRSRGGDNPWAENTVLLLLNRQP